MRSWLVAEGALDSSDFSVLEDQVLGRSFDIMDDGERAMQVRIACIDSGYRTDEGYDFCQVRVNTRPVKGASRSAQRPYWSTMVDVHPVTGRRLRGGGVRLWMLDTDFFKDFIYRRMQLPPDSEFGWHIHQDVTLDYAEQITSEQKVTVRKGRKEREEWQPKRAGGKNHLWDAEVYAAAAAHIQGMQFWKKPLVR